MQRTRLWKLLVGTFVVGLLLCAPKPAHAGIDACFEDAQSVAMCNGFIAALAGLGGSVGPALVLYDPEGASAGTVALGVGLGLYAGVSGGALVASSQAQEPGSPLRDSGTILGGIDLALSGTSLLLSALAGVTIAVSDGSDSTEDDDLDLSLGVGVPGATGHTAGLTITGRF